MKRKNIIFLAVLAHAAILTAQTTETTDSVANELREIVVKANQPATRLVGNTLVSTIVGSKLQNIGTCLDALSQLPMLSVTDGEVSVIGKGSPEILIDGRPMRDAEELIQLRSDNVKKVELVLAPGAIYESDTKAVLKITTKKNFIDGLSIVDRAEITARRKWSANDYLDLNYRTGRLDFFVSGTLAHNNSLIKGSTTNTLMCNGVRTVAGSSQHKTYPTTTAPVKGGFNYADGSQSFGAYYRFNPERGHFSNNGSEWLDNGPRINRDIASRIRAHSHLVSAYYDNTFAEKYNLHFDGNYRSSSSKTNIATSYPGSQAADVASDDCNNSTLWAGKIYLAMPLWKGNFTIGTQDSYTHTTLDYRMLNTEVSQYIPSSVNDARQTSAAIFTNWERTLGRMNLSAGLRYEYIDYIFTLNGSKDNDLSRADHLLTPDFSIGYSFNDRVQASLSYRMSTVRPPYSRLTGSLSYVGLHEIEGGNPALRDEHMHDIQLFGMWNNFIVQADFTRSLDTYAFVKKIYPAKDLQLIMQPVNIDVSAVDVYLVWSGNIRAWAPGITVGMHRQWLEIEGTHYNKPIFSYYFDNTVSLPKGFMFTLNAYGQTAGDMHTNRFGTTWFSLDASLSKSFFNRAMQVNISATDIFNTSNNDWTMYTCGVYVDKSQSYDRRGVSLSVTYRFNTRKSNYKGKNASDAEINRL